MGNFVVKFWSGRGLLESQQGIKGIDVSADEYKVTECLYGHDELVMTQFELEDKISNGDEKVVHAGSLAMIQCVGCKNADKDYCAWICCRNAIRNALHLKELNPRMYIYILFRNKSAFGFSKNYYRTLVDKDIRFIRYKLHNTPKVETIAEGVPSGVRVILADPVSGYRLVIHADVLALVAPVFDSTGE